MASFRATLVSSLSFFSRVDRLQDSPAWRRAARRRQLGTEANHGRERQIVEKPSLPAKMAMTYSATGIGM